MFPEPENPLPKAPLIHIWVPRGYGRIHDLRYNLRIPAEFSRRGGKLEDQRELPDPCSGFHLAKNRGDGSDHDL